MRYGDHPSLRYRVPWLGILVLVALVCTHPARGAQNSPSAKPGDCRECHGGETVLPPDHPDTKGRAWTDCLGCHGNKASNLKGRVSLVHVHHLSDIGCRDCHGETTPFKAIGKAQCFNCHGSGEGVAKRTAHREPNPHLSVHYGADLDCDLCHHVHGKSENFCNQCHEFKFVVP
jgi:hypothetical protein